jgi:hypothetical protein
VCNQIKEMAWKILAYNVDRMARALQLLFRVIRLWTTPNFQSFFIRICTILNISSILQKN